MWLTWIASFFMKFRTIVLVVLGLAVFMFLYLSIEECKSNKEQIVSLVEENQFLEQKCENEKFEDKWEAIAFEVKNRRKENNETNETFNVDDFDTNRTIYF